MPKVSASMDLYNEYAKILYSRKCVLEKKDIEQLLEVIKKELIIDNNSSIVDAAYWSCLRFFSNCHILYYKYTPISFNILNREKSARISPFDAWWIIILCSDYLLHGSIADSIDALLPKLFRKNKLENADANVFIQLLQQIDAEVKAHREKMFDYYNKHDKGSCDSEPQGVDAYDEMNTRQGDPLISTTQEEKQEGAIPPNAEDAEKEHQEIINKAQEDANLIIQQASLEAEIIITSARKHATDMVPKSRTKEFDIEQQNVHKGILEIKSTLLQTNETIKSIEEFLVETATKKAIGQLLELFNLISDSKESAFALAHQNNDQELENAAYNMDVFIDMIIEYMMSYGIKPLTSMPGDNFSTKLHALRTKTNQFDPRTATIKVSKRNGFLWGEQVLQKEQVEI